MNPFPFPKRAIHIDFHTMPGVYYVGCDFRAREFARTLKNAGVEYVTVSPRKIPSGWECVAIGVGVGRRTGRGYDA